MSSIFRSIFFCLLPLLALSGCDNRVELMSSATEVEANEVYAALNRGGIDVRKVPGKDGVIALTVAPSNVGRAVDLLRETGLPRERYAGMGQIFRKDGLISSPLEERARYLYALSQELGATISQIDGVLVARVHVVLPERSTLGETSTPASAAVFIKHREGFDLEAVQPQIRRLVTNSIAGLTPDKVSIVLIAAHTQREAAHVAETPSVVVLSVVGGVLVLVLVLAWLLWGWRAAIKAWLLDLRNRKQAA